MGHPLSPLEPQAAVAPQLGGVGQTVAGVLERPEPKRVLGMTSHVQTGPFDPGWADGRDKHNLGFDADGHAINSLHLSTNTLFIGDGADFYCGGAGDAPLEFNCWREPDPGLYPVPVRLGYDPNSEHSWCGGTKPGLWRWWGMCNYYIPNSGAGQTLSKQSHTAHLAGAGTTIGDIYGFPGLEIAPRKVGDQSERYVATVVQTAMPVVLGRPNLIRPGFADLRSHIAPDRRSLKAQDLFTPITYRLEAYGAQGGAETGKILGDNSAYAGTWVESEHWNYTELPGRGRYDGGTASGGLVLMPPEVDLADIDEGLAPGHVTRSTVFMIAAPGARFGAGLPNLANGGLDSGYSWFVDTNGELTFNRHDGAGAGLGVGVLRLDTNGDILALDDLSILAKKAAIDTAGFDIAVAAGEAGAAFAAAGKAGGTLSLDGGVGGAGTGALVSGAGQTLNLRGGNAGADGGFGRGTGGPASIKGGVGSNGGPIEITGGNATGTGGAVTVRGGDGTVTDGDVVIGDLHTDEVKLGASGNKIGFYGTTPVVQSAAYTRNAAVVEDRTLLASASATTLNNNNVLAALIADLQSIGLIG